MGQPTHRLIFTRNVSSPLNVTVQLTLERASKPPSPICVDTERHKRNIVRQRFAYQAVTGRMPEQEAFL